jgi:hypothetical protein
MNRLCASADATGAGWRAVILWFMLAGAGIRHLAARRHLAEANRGYGKSRTNAGRRTDLSLTPRAAMPSVAAYQRSMRALTPNVLLATKTPY